MMIHGASREALTHPGFHEAMTQLKAENRLRHVGVSCHGRQWSDADETMENVLLAAIADGRFDVVLLVYNFLNRDAGARVLKACKEKNVGATLMKTNPTANYLRALDRIDMKGVSRDHPRWGEQMAGFFRKHAARLKARSDKAQRMIQAHDATNPSELRNAATRFALSHPDVHSVCCSIETFDVLDSFLRLSGTKLSPADQAKLVSYERGYSPFYCRHACGLCESRCPKGVPVNTIMRYNHYFVSQGRERYAMEKYARLRTRRAEQCFACSGDCELACPHGVPVQSLLAVAHETLTLA
jgi:predicted aldo/keto reductase-like oxidoreductase